MTKKLTKILKAISSPTRTQILNTLNTKGPQTYTQLMKTLKLNPTTDAGRFAYHLKTLLKTNLIEPNTKNKTYQITQLGKTTLTLTEQIKKQTQKTKKLQVRTSRLSIEEFDKNKITQSLTKEANIPTELAQKIANETEKRLQQFKTKYLTAPLIREIVNTILIEKGHEEYRHKLTRLGLPVHDVTQLIKTTAQKNQNIETIHKKAGDAVIEEYTLLNILPRDIADAHMSGTIHIKNLGYWILKPNQIIHNLRFFLQHGLNMQKIKNINISFPPPKTLKSALILTSNIIKNFTTEISEEQTINFFNIFLAPYTKNLPTEKIKENLNTFLNNLNQSITTRGQLPQLTIGLELLTPEFLIKKEAIGPHGKTTDTYANFTEESQKITSILLDLILEKNRKNPFFNPKLIINMRPNTLKNKESEHLLFKAHKLAAERGIPYFANLTTKTQQQATYSSTGYRLATDWKGDWELDTMQTGNLDEIIINLPRIAYQAEGNYEKFFEKLYEKLEMATRALKIKHQVIKQHFREELFLFLTQKIQNDNYFRLENASHIVSFVGLNEAVQSLSGEPIHKDTHALNLAQDILNYILFYNKETLKKLEARILPAMTPCETITKRLAKLDIEKYGWAKVNVQGSKKHPFYTDMTAVPLSANIPWKKRLSIEEKFHQLTPGGHLALLQLTNQEHTPDELLSITKQITKTFNIGLYAYNRNLSYCQNCHNVSYGILPKCPYCGSIDAMTRYTRISAKHQEVSLLPLFQRDLLRKRVSYMFISK